jgi:hypothetical protein
MAPSFSGWSRRFLADGLMLYPPAGRALGGIRIQDRVRPLIGIRTLVDQLISASAGFLAQTTLRPLERLVTLDGEYAAVVTVAARRVADGRPVERTLAMIFAEDHYTRVDGVIQDPTEFEAFGERVRDLVRHLSVGLGWQRRRRFLHALPSGWTGVARTYSTEWYPASYPRDDGVMTVFHAKPLAVAASQTFERMLREDLSGGLVEDGIDPPVPAVNDHGLAGEVTVRSGVYAGQGRRHFHQAALLDHRFLYLVRLETGDAQRAEHVAALDALVRSIQPLPLAQQESEEPAVTHWLA